LRAGGAALTLAAREAWLDALPEGAVAPRSIERRENAHQVGSGEIDAATRALFAGCTRVESWTGHGDQNVARRLAAASGAAVAVHPFRALRAGEHASAYYGRCVGVAPRVQRLPIRPAAAQWADELWRRHGLGSSALAMHAGSGSARKNWEGMADAAAAWRDDGGQVIALLGPAEDERAARVPCDVALRGERLDRVAAVLARARCFLGNDSGIGHLAGLVGARGLALFGPSDPVAWRPLGEGVGVLHAPDACRRCGEDRFCLHRLSVREVLARLRG
jgi:hypothetical protein